MIFISVRTAHPTAYVLMTNHVHLLLTPLSQNSISLFFQGLGRQYVTYINKTYGLSGSLWEGRHKGNSIDTEEPANVVKKG